jgi:hypothetical protein
MNIDNIETINEYLKFPDTNINKRDEIVYLIEFVQCIKGKNVIMDYFYLFTKNDLQKYKKLIVNKCKNNNASAWIYIQPRNLVSIGTQVQIAMNIAISKQNYRSIRGVYPKVCKRSPGKSNDYVVQINTNDNKLKSQFFEFIQDQCHEFKVIPMQNGCQYIIPREQLALFEPNKVCVTIIKKNPKVLLFQ